MHYKSVSIVLGALISLVTADTYVIQLIDGFSVASLGPDEPLITKISPYLKETISIGAFSCLVADLPSEDQAFSLLSFPSVKRVSEDASVRAFVNLPLPSSGEATEDNSTTLESFHVQIEGPFARTAAGISNSSSTLGTQETQENAPDHLLRIGARNGLFADDAPNTYDYNLTGEGVNVYIVDTGVDIEHPEFEGRAERGYNGVVGEADGDNNGHGTHVAGLVASNTYGVAKKAKVIEVKVLNRKGSGVMSTILAGLEWASKHRVSKDSKGILNMSLGGFYVAIINDAVNAVLRSGMAVVVAAGNDRSSAAYFSPASAAEAITVGAMDASKDTILSFSNFGEKVDVFAPGVSISSLDNRNYEAPTIYSGTSMASPIVAGVAALYMEEGVAADTMRATLILRSTTGALAKSLRRSWRYYSTPDRIVYTGDLSHDSRTATSSPFDGSDALSKTALPSFAQISQTIDQVKEMKYKVFE